MATTLVYSIHFENDRIELIKMNSIKMNKIKIIFFSHSLKDYVVGSFWRFLDWNNATNRNTVQIPMISNNLISLIFEIV